MLNEEFDESLKLNYSKSKKFKKKQKYIEEMVKKTIRKLKNKLLVRKNY